MLYFYCMSTSNGCGSFPRTVAIMATTPPEDQPAPLEGAPAPAALAPGPSAAVVWSERFLDYTWTPQHPMKPARLAYTMALAESLGVLEGVERIAPRPASESDLLRVHTPAYLQAVEQAQAPPVALHAPPYGLGSEDNPVFPRMHAAASVIVGGTLAAAREIAEGRTRRAVSIGGGMHHAMADAAAGFCIYNDAAVAISWLLDHGFDRIAYLDVDVHHGDGVQRAFYHDPRVLTFSIHQHPATLWPNTGWPDETGSGAASGTAVNLAVLPGTADAQWLRGFHAVVPGVLAAFRPQIIVGQCGVDTHREDPLADLELTVDGQRAAFLAMRDLADRYAEGRWLAVGGGGYSPVRVVPRAWTHLLATALDRDVDPSTPVPSTWIEAMAAEAPTVTAPPTMGDGGDIAYRPWDGPGGTPETGDPRVDRAQRAVDTAVTATRRAVFGLLGLDAEDPRD